MRSDQIKLGFERAPHRGLLRATGVVGENDFDLIEHRLDVQLSPEQIEQRLSAAKPPKERVKSSWLRRYAAMVTSANTGAVLADYEFPTINRGTTTPKR